MRLQARCRSEFMMPSLDDPFSGLPHATFTQLQGQDQALTARMSSPCLMKHASVHLLSQRFCGGQYLRRMSRNFHFAPDVADDPLAVDQERAALHAHIAAAIHALLDP